MGCIVQFFCVIIYKCDGVWEDAFLQPSCLFGWRTCLRERARTGDGSAMIFSLRFLVLEVCRSSTVDSFTLVVFLQTWWCAEVCECHVWWLSCTRRWWRWWWQTQWWLCRTAPSVPQAGWTSAGNCSSLEPEDSTAIMVLLRIVSAGRVGDFSWNLPTSPLFSVCLAPGCCDCSRRPPDQPRICKQNCEP